MQNLRYTLRTVVVSLLALLVVSPGPSVLHAPKDSGRVERLVVSLQSHAGRVHTTITDIEERQAREESAEGAV